MVAFLDIGGAEKRFGAAAVLQGVDLSVAKGEFVSLLGDRTLPRYRAMAARQLGPACPVPGAALPPDEAAATLQAWLDEFERVQLILRLSARLRDKHGD